jgi:HPt (histidine-containing phosphotransfer) domain-containing protein
MTASRPRPAAHRGRKPAVIDEAHLERITLGDRRLEREVLEIFLRQTTIMLARIAGAAEPAQAAAAAHALLGSARGIGAWRVASAAETLERAANALGTAQETEGTDAALEGAVAELKAASLEASAAIGARLTMLLAEHARQR